MTNEERVALLGLVKDLLLLPEHTQGIGQGGAAVDQFHDAVSRDAVIGIAARIAEVLAGRPTWPAEVEAAVGERMWFLRASPNLCDGQHATYAGPGGATIAQLSEWLESWWENDCEEGETITLQVVRMTQAEYDAIPEC